MVLLGTRFHSDNFVIVFHAINYSSSRFESTQSVFVHSMLLTAVTDFHKGESPREGKR